MKTRLIALLCAPTLIAGAIAEEENSMIEWYDANNGVVAGTDGSEPTKIKLSEIKEAIVDHFGPIETTTSDVYVESFTYKDIIIEIDDTCTYVQYNEPWGGAPNSVAIGKDVVWVFDDPSITFADRVVSFTLYVPNEDYSSAQAGSLTINLTDNYLKGQSWISKGGEGTVDAYYIPFMECQ